MGLKILTVHGWAFCPEVFKPLEGLGDVRHHRLEYRSLGEEVQRLVERIDGDTLLVGWSLGATLSVLASLKNSPKGLVLIGATPHFGRAWKREYLERFFKELEGNFGGKVREFRNLVWGEEICEDLPPEEGAKELLREFVQTDISNPLRELRIPTLLLHGRKDPVVPFREAKKVLKLNPRFRLTVYDGGHFPKDFTPRDWEGVFESLQELPPLGYPAEEGG